jgi:cytidylate kinase
MSEKQTIITIDGPAGVGKSTVSRRVAAATGFTYLDTGAMYRGVGLFLVQEKVNLQNGEEIAEKLTHLDIELLPARTETADVGVKVNGIDVSDSIRTPEMAMVASKVSALFEVRDFLTKMQREYGARGKIVAEGRDIGTVVFPQAAHKFFLDAKPEERSRRRCAQLQAKGEEADYEKILSMTLERDKNDREREIAPLKQATDAVYIDTTEVDIEGVVEGILKSVRG